MRTIIYPQVNLLIVTPVFRAFDMTKRCIENIEKNTLSSFYHILVDDNSPELIPFEASPERTIITLKNEWRGLEHKEQIVKAMDIGLDYAKKHIRFKWFAKVETDALPEHGWDKKLIDLGNELSTKEINWSTVEGQHVDVGVNDPQEFIEKRIEEETKGGGLAEVDYNELSCALFSQEIMHFPWWFSIVPDHHDVNLDPIFKNMGQFKQYRTKETYYLHYRGSSRSQMDDS